MQTTTTVVLLLSFVALTFCANQCYSVTEPGQKNPNSSTAVNCPDNNCMKKVYKLHGNVTTIWGCGNGTCPSQAGSHTEGGQEEHTYCCTGNLCNGTTTSTYMSVSVVLLLIMSIILKN